MLLYGSTDSGHSYKVRSFLLLADWPHDYRWIDLTASRQERPKAFVLASKFGEVPVLIDESYTFCQSNAILLYLAQRTGLFAGEVDEWQGVQEWLFWETNRVGFSVPNLRFALRWSKQPPEVLAFLRARAIADLSTLDAFLSEQMFLLPSGPTIADISCSAYLFWLKDADLDESAFPNVQRWLADIRGLPHWTHPDVAMLSGGLAKGN
ncbi:hypothetical protein ASC76_10260 [Rhizobacter sp. Root404]|nr:hypothetical protein ASC76_10260 [Rhizobacter sp. Root404]